MIRLSVLEIEGGSPERYGEGEGEEGLVLEYSSSWMSQLCRQTIMKHILWHKCPNIHWRTRPQYETEKGYCGGIQFLRFN